MTPREWARLQGFPDNFKFLVADTHLYKQFGNSVTVPVIRAIAEKIKEHLEKENIEAGKKEEVFEQLAFTRIKLLPRLFYIFIKTESSTVMRWLKNLNRKIQ